MNEIEIKAHVKNRNLLIEKLNKIAQFKGSVVKNDKFRNKKILHSNMKTRLYIIG